HQLRVDKLSIEVHRTHALPQPIVGQVHPVVLGIAGAGARTADAQTASVADFGVFSIGDDRGDILLGIAVLVNGSVNVSFRSAHDHAEGRHRVGDDFVVDLVVGVGKLAGDIVRIPSRGR